jgi:uncharacterized protein (DUF169 family)
MLMSRYGHAAQTFTELLGMLEPPIAVAFADEPPPGVAPLAERAPAACAIWRLAETQTFYANAADHTGCSVGAHVMGFSLPPETAQELTATAGLMLESGYMGAEEIAQLPRIAEPHGGIVYGPLIDFPVEAQAALLWVNPAQAMLLEESIGAAQWPESEDQRHLFGRPGCGALSVTVNTGRATRSLGCACMRTFSNVSGDMMFHVLPGADINATAERLESVYEANEQMLFPYQQHLAAFELAERDRRRARVS